MNHKDTKTAKTHEEGDLGRADRFHTVEAKRRADEVSYRVIGAAIEVHRVLGPGLLESVYELALLHELQLQGIRCERQVLIPVTYKDSTIQPFYRIDILVEDLVIVELKSVENLDPLHTSQLLTYLRISDRQLGLLFNFNIPQLKNGIKRILNN